MRAPQSNSELERKQREALRLQRADLWRLAYRGFQTGGRGWIIADGSHGSRTQPMTVRWRSGREILGARGDIFGWVQQAAQHVRMYDPRREFVLQYVSPDAAVQVSRIIVPPHAQNAAASASKEGASNC